MSDSPPEIVLIEFEVLACGGRGHVSIRKGHRPSGGRADPSSGTEPGFEYDPKLAAGKMCS
jgi:hypothetical protein